MGAIIARWQLVQREAWHAWHGMAGGNGVEREEGWKGGKGERRGWEKKYLRACTVGVER